MNLPPLNSEENVTIKVDNQVTQEKSLIKSSEINTLLFQCLLITFSSSLMTQLIFLVPASYKLLNLLPNIFLAFCIGATLIVIIIKKHPTLKTYLLLLAFLVGIVMGI